MKAHLLLAAPLVFCFATIAAAGTVAQAKTLNVCDLVPVTQAAQILGFPVDTSHSGDTSSHCMYVGKSGYADLRVTPGDESRMSMMMGAHRSPPGHSLAFGHKGSYLVYVTTAPKMDNAAKALRDAALGRL